MKKNLVLLSVVAAFILTSSFAFAGATAAMRVNVPFEFYLEDQLLPAGEYSFEMGSINGAIASSVIVRTTDGTGIRMLVTLPGTEGNSSMDQVRFNQLNGRHFLSSVSIRGHKATLKMLSLEKELRSQLEKAGQSPAIAEK